MAAPRGRKPDFKMPEEHRVKIKNSNILNALIEHVTEDRPMTSSQVTAGLGLLKKVLPDLQSVQVGGDPDNPIKTEEVGGASAKLAAYLDTLAERSTETGEPSE